MGDCQLSFSAGHSRIEKRNFFEYLVFNKMRTRGKDNRLKGEEAMRKFLFILVCAVFAVPPSWLQAQPADGIENAIEKRTENIERFKEKHPKASEVIEKRRERLEEFKEKHPGRVEELSEKRQERIEKRKETRRDRPEEADQSFEHGVDEKRIPSSECLREDVAAKPQPRKYELVRVN
jgi:hypothetical protein